MNAELRDSLLSQKYSSKGVAVFSSHENIYFTLFSELKKAGSVGEFKCKINKIVNRMGFSDFIFRRLDHKDSDPPVLTTLPDELLRVYSEEGYYNHDLMIACARFNAQPIFSSLVYKYICDAPFETNLIAINRSIVKLYRRFGFYDFYSVSAPSCNGSEYRAGGCRANNNVQLVIADKGLCSADFQSKTEPYQFAFRQLCKAIDNVAADRFPTLLMSEDERQALSITAKPLSVLNRLANTDLTITELAQQMCISPITAHQHIAGVRKALGVKTNIAAVKKAIKLKLISFV